MILEHKDGTYTINGRLYGKYINYSDFRKIVGARLLKSLKPYEVGLYKPNGAGIATKYSVYKYKELIDLLTREESE